MQNECDKYLWYMCHCQSTKAAQYEGQPFGFQRSRSLNVQYINISILLEQQQPIRWTDTIVSATRSGMEITRLTFKPWSPPTLTHVLVTAGSLLHNTQLFPDQQSLQWITPAGALQAKLARLHVFVCVISCWLSIAVRFNGQHKWLINLCT